MAAHGTAGSNGCMGGVVRALHHRWRSLTLLGVSVLLHALGLGYLALQQGEQARPSPSRPLELELAWVDAAPAEATPGPAPSPAPAPARPHRTKPRATAPASGGSGALLQAEVPATPEAPLGARGDAPVAKAPTLTPGLGFVLQLPEGDAEPARGTTVRNLPGELPDAAAQAEYRAETLGRALNADLAREVGRAAVAVGSVPGHFTAWQRAMREALPKATIRRRPLTAQEQAEDVASVLFAPGISAEAARKLTDSPLGRSVQLNSMNLVNAEDQRFREAGLQLLAQTEALKERMARVRLRTVLEVTTDPRGALAEVAVVEKSGDPEFDESVLHFSRQVARSLPDGDQEALGASWWRARWQFTWEPPQVKVKLLEAWRAPPPLLQ